MTNSIRLFKALPDDAEFIFNMCAKADEIDLKNKKIIALNLPIEHIKIIEQKINSKEVIYFIISQEEIKVGFFEVHLYNNYCIVNSRFIVEDYMSKSITKQALPLLASMLENMTLIVKTSTFQNKLIEEYLRQGYKRTPKTEIVNGISYHYFQKAK